MTVNDRDRRFCEEYLIDLNAKRAALRAGFAPSTAKDASMWINPQHPEKPALRVEIDRLMAERSRRTGVSADRVVRELARIAFADLTDVLDITASDVRGDIGRDDSAALARIKRRQTADGVECEIHMHDKNRALELLGKHLGLFTENVRLQQVLPVIIDDVGEEDENNVPKIGDGDV